MLMPCERSVCRRFDEMPPWSDCLNRSWPPVKRFLADAAILVTFTQTCPQFMSMQAMLREEMVQSHRFPS